MRNSITIALTALGLSLSLSACGSNADQAPEDTTTDDPTALTAAEQKAADAATTEFVEWVQNELAELVPATEEFATALKAGNDDEARAIYPVARAHWERVEPIAAQFGDLDPAIDAREAGLDEGEDWTGWHRLEKDLWPARAEDYTALTDAEQAELADKLVADTKTIESQGHDLELTLADLVDGSQGLLEEVAGSKVTGEEEYWSRTDLWDFQANLDGSRKAFELYEDLLAGRDAELADSIEGQFDAVQDLLDETKVGDGYKTYDQLAQDEIKAMSDAVNALGESLAEVSAIL